MIKINSRISIDTSKIVIKAILSSGSGGQHINKVSTAILLQFDLTVHDYPNWFLNKIMQKNRKRISKKGILSIKVNSYRSQTRNKDEAINRLIKIFSEAAHYPKQRKKTFPTVKSKMKRLEKKKLQSKKKKLRKSPKIYD